MPAYEIGNRVHHIQKGYGQLIMITTPEGDTPAKGLVKWEKTGTNDSVALAELRLVNQSETEPPKELK
jgi:hypothetical protein